MRRKNAARRHLIAPFTNINTVPADSAFIPLDRWISSMSDSTDEEIDDTGFYHGDGTPESTVVSVQEGWDFEGFYDSTNPGHQLIAGMKHETGEGRHIWHRIISSDSTQQWTGHATVTDIVTGGGDATAHEEFSCTITFNQTPTQATPTGLVAPLNESNITPFVGATTDDDE